MTSIPCIYNTDIIWSIIAIKLAAPLILCLIIKQSARIADKLAIVSINDSPFDWEEFSILKFTTFAFKLLAAISNVVLVRVDGSKKG